MDIETIDKIKSSKSSKSKIHEAGKMFHIPLNMSECVWVPLFNIITI